MKNHGTGRSVATCQKEKSM